MEDSLDRPNLVVSSINDEHLEELSKDCQDDIGEDNNDKSSSEKDEEEKNDNTIDNDTNSINQIENESAASNLSPKVDSPEEAEKALDLVGIMDDDNNDIGLLNKEDRPTLDEKKVLNDEELLPDDTPISPIDNSIRTIPSNFSEDKKELPQSEIISEDSMEDKDKSRFNLRKRMPVLSNAGDYGSDDFDFDVGTGYYKTSKKFKFNLAKKNYRRQRPYTNEAVKIAVKMIQSKKMNLQEASREFKIPRTSLHNFVQLYRKGRKIAIKNVSPALTKHEESEIVSLVMKLSKCGKRYSHNELRFLVQYYLISNDRPIFKSGTLPTMGWISGLVERHPVLMTAKSKKNTKVAVEDVEEWQSQIEDYLVNDWDLNIDQVFCHEQSNRIFCFNAFRMLINSPGGDSSDHNKSTPIKKESGAEDNKPTDIEAGILLGISADGSYMDPMLILPEDKSDECPPNENEDLRIAFNSNGRVDEEIALRAVKEFDEFVKLSEIVKPVVFFVNDKHDLAHFSVIEYCWENQIIIVCLPPKTTKTMTPFEIGIWPKLRSQYSTLWKNAPKTVADNKIGIGQFPEMFMQAWEPVKVAKTAVRGFLRSGIIPFNVPAVIKASDQNEKQQIQAVIDKQKLIQQEIDIQNMKKRQKTSSSNESSPCREFDQSESETGESIEERSRGKLEGIEMCLKAIESYVPRDVLPVWNERGADYRGRCEMSFKLWRSVSLLLKAGRAMASIQQMSNGGIFENPFGASDFVSTSSFFRKIPSVPAKIKTEAPPLPPPATSKKRKLKINKSIYSKSEPIDDRESDLQQSSSFKSQPKVCANETNPFVKLYPNVYMEDETV